MHEALSSVRSGPVELRFEGLGVFGEARKAGVPPEARRFVPHVTLARLKGHREDADPLARFMSEKGAGTAPPVRAVAFSLMSSRLRPEGAVYEELARYPMMG